MVSLHYFQESEIISLIVAVPLFVAVLILCLKVFTRFTASILASTVFAMGAVVFTVVEDITLGSFFNWLEHICYALTGIFLGVGSFLASRQKSSLQKIGSQ